MFHLCCKSGLMNCVSQSCQLYVINCKSQYLGAPDGAFEFWEDFVSSDQWND